MDIKTNATPRIHQNQHLWLTQSKKGEKIMQRKIHATPIINPIQHLWRVLLVVNLLIFLLFLTHGTIEAKVTPELDKALQGTLDKIRESFALVGVTVAVTLPKQGTWVGASGLSDWDAKTAMVPENLSRIGSITKTFTASTVLQLVEEGKLTLDDSVEQWLPKLIKNGENITIRHLLSHTSGIFSYNESSEVWKPEDMNKVWKPEELVALATSHPPYFAPGEGWHYSNTGYILLGMIVEAATKSTIAQEIRRRFLEPLKLNHTFFDGVEKVPGGLAHGYEVGVDVGFYPVSWTWAAGAIVSNAEDLLRWAEALYGGNVLQQASLDKMLTFVELGGYGYGLGVERIPTSMGLLVGHSGGVPGFTSFMFFLPDKEMTLVILTNGISIENELNQNPSTVFILDFALSELSKLEIPAPTAVSTQGKLTTTWGEVKQGR